MAVSFIILWQAEHLAKRLPNRQEKMHVASDMLRRMLHHLQKFTLNSSNELICLYDSPSYYSIPQRLKANTDYRGIRIPQGLGLFDAIVQGAQSARFDQLVFIREPLFVGTRDLESLANNAYRGRKTFALLQPRAANQALNGQIACDSFLYNPFNSPFFCAFSLNRLDLRHAWRESNLTQKKKILEMRQMRNFLNFISNQLMQGNWHTEKVESNRSVLLGVQFSLRPFTSTVELLKDIRWILNERKPLVHIRVSRFMLPIAQISLLAYIATAWLDSRSLVFLFVPILLSLRAVLMTPVSHKPAAFLHLVKRLFQG